MSFIRVKTRVKSGKRYSFAYEVENKWFKKEKKTKQRVKKYLGRVFELSKTMGQSEHKKEHKKEHKENFQLKPQTIYSGFLDYLQVDEDGFIDYLDSISMIDMFFDLIEFSLKNLGFVKGTGRMKNRLIYGEFIYDTLHHKVYSAKTKKPIVLAINNGYLCDFSIRKLIRFKPEKFDDAKKLGKEFAKLILSSGIRIRPEIFVELFEKLQNEHPKLRKKLNLD